MQANEVARAECVLWAEAEFGGAQLGDRRLTQRLTALAAALAAHPGASLPAACGAWAATKGAYRFLAQSRLTLADMLAPHHQQTRTRCQAESVVLVVQDTTSLTYGERPGLGRVGSGPAAGATGLWLHCSLACTPTGQPLGLVQVNVWARSPATVGQAAQRARRAQAEKESQRWLDSYAACVAGAATPGPQWVNVADREGDLYGLFLAAQATPAVGVLVRARHNRRTPEGVALDTVIQATAVAGLTTLAVPRRPGQRARTAQLAVRFAAVQVQAPKNSGQPGRLPLWVVEARETEGGPLHWRLLTNLPVRTLADALEKLQWYRVRWQIEDYHRVLKSGCQAERRQLATGAGLQKILALDLVVAWRVLALSREARETPAAPAETAFTAEECTVLAQYRERVLRRPPAPLTLPLAVRTVAQMGGFLARTGDGQPGAMTLWRGLDRLAALVEGWRLATTYG